MRSGVAKAKILALAAELGLEVGDLQTPKPSCVGTKSFCAHVADGKGIVYCHASGALSGAVFYVPKGIGWFYKNKLGGSQSEIGLPVSNEHESLVSEGGRVQKVLFERGYVEFETETGLCKAVLDPGGGDSRRLLLNEMKL